MNYAVCLALTAVILSRQSTVDFINGVRQDMAKKPRSITVEDLKDSKNKSVKNIESDVSMASLSNQKSIASSCEFRGKEDIDSKESSGLISSGMTIINELEKTNKKEMPLDNSMNKPEENDVFIEKMNEEAGSRVSLKDTDEKAMQKSEQELTRETAILLTKRLFIKLESAAGIDRNKSTALERENRKVKMATEINKISDKIEINKEKLAKLKEESNKAMKNSGEGFEVNNTKSVG